MRGILEIAEGIKSEFMNNATLRELYGMREGQVFDEVFSKLSIESVTVFVFASASWVLENLFAKFSKEVNERIEGNIVLSEAWYHRAALDFQYGVPRFFDSKTYGFRYEGVDVSRLIVRHAAVRTVKLDGLSVVRVLYAGVGKTAITGDERTAFESYMRLTGAAGTHYDFVSLDANDIEVKLNVFYDPLTMDSTGKRIDDKRDVVGEAICGYLDRIEYGGVFYRSALVDAIQGAEGVMDVELTGIFVDGVENGERRILAPSGAYNYVATAGYIHYYIN